ncbi:MAG: sulfotransferase family 2 domain-containing protein [Bauldia sp.]|uniref:sulfotransferase family 2 domain-containing protein n=1 Tax=Bauldia sp. TaxID=2575872 RepID=UPI001D956B52|nr:sulfotransferase family 2 domain-containing protein [Bauldia sp.]MCB1495944.1 sulfotransferase family 2 domain-containing protein [Bauldia sp.]
MKKSYEKNLRLQAARSKRSGYLHIPKTGGSGIGQFLNKLTQTIGAEKVPTKFNHPWTVEHILQQFPEISIHVVIRDPVERMVSGFLSRMRMGRPRRNHIWNTPEAISFSFFSEPQQLLRALVSDDERLKSAALFAYAGIRHLRWNYVYYFQSPDYVDRIEKNIGVVREIDDTDAFLGEICSVCNVEPAMADKLYSKVHVSKVSPRSITSVMDEDEIARVKAALEPEYAIYRQLQAIARRQSAA